MFDIGDSDRYNSALGQILLYVLLAQQPSSSSANIKMLMAGITKEIYQHF